MVLFIWITIAGVAGQSCCTGQAAGGGSAAPPASGTTASDCKSADSAYTWVFKTCPASAQARHRALSFSVTSAVKKRQQAAIASLSGRLAD